MDYLGLITSQHRGKPNFTAVLNVLTAPLVAAQAVLAEFSSSYDLDSAVGSQLDAVGEWIGTTRRLRAPIDNVFFSWDTAGKGWDEGYWKGPFVPAEGVAEMDDSSYRAALRLRVAVNHWSGQNQSYRYLPVKLEGTNGNIITVVDNQDMSMRVVVLGIQPSLFFRLVVQQQELTPKPLGVRITGYEYRNTPVYGHDFSDTLYDGMDRGFYAV